MRDAAGRRSATGPGKPYWKRPLGSTGATAVERMNGSGRAGIGAGGPVVVGKVEIVVVVVETMGACLGLLEYSAAVTAAPATALVAAIAAIVIFDMVFVE